MADLEAELRNSIEQTIELAWNREISGDGAADQIMQDVNEYVDQLKIRFWAEKECAE